MAPRPCRDAFDLVAVTKAQRSALAIAWILSRSYPGGEFAACHLPVSGCKWRIMARVSADLLSFGLLVAGRSSIELTPPLTRINVDELS
jgi:hypothetical protein